MFSFLITTGDLFASQQQTLVNTVNCKGVMGAGIALRCKELYPEVFADYAKRCSKNEVSVGKPYLFPRITAPWILNFPTKKHWRNPSKLSYISDGLSFLSRSYEEWGITSLAFPALGCGHGGLSWSEVGPIMYTYLSQFTIPIEIYAPLGTPKEQLYEEYLKQRAPIIESSPVFGNGHLSQLGLFPVDTEETLGQFTSPKRKKPSSRASTSRKRK